VTKRKTNAVSRVFFNDAYTACAYRWDTTRKSAWIAEALRVRPIDGVVLDDPSSFTDTAEAIVRRVHESTYVDAVRSGEPADLAASQGFTWDAGLYPTAIAHSAGLVAATERVLRHGDPWAGSLSSGLHHASFERGKGFCTFNGLAVAAQHAYDLGARHILVIDFDAHCGGGTYSTTRHLPVTQIDVSCESYDRWRPVDTDLSSELMDAQVDNYLDTIRRALERATARGPWDFVIYNAGMDPRNSGVPAEQLAERERLVAQWCTAPTIVTLAGGYTSNISEHHLVSLHRSTFEAFATHASRGCTVA
jgi:acetoin utilization deacetylase AcuC-like enzyme